MERRKRGFAERVLEDDSKVSCPIGDTGHYGELFMEFLNTGVYGLARNVNAVLSAVSRRYSGVITGWGEGVAIWGMDIPSQRFS